jgi:hypothetical protein
LSTEVLHKIWSMGDKGDKGYLTREEFYSTMQLVAAAKKDRTRRASTFNIGIVTPEQVPPTHTPRRHGHSAAAAHPTPWPRCGGPIYAATA